MKAASGHYGIPEREEGEEVFSYIYRTSPLGGPHFHVDDVDRAGIGGNHGRIISPLADRLGCSGTVRGGRCEDGQLGVSLGGRPTRAQLPPADGAAEPAGRLLLASHDMPSSRWSRQ